MGVQKISSLETVVSRVEQQVQQLNESDVKLQQNDIEQRQKLNTAQAELAIVKDGSSRKDDVSRLELKLRKTGKSLSELRQAGSDWESTTEYLQEEDGITTLKEYASQVAALRREVGEVRAELSEGRERRETASSSTFPSHELDILVTSMSKIGNRASQVESLQMEFELFKTRTHRLEARLNTQNAAREDVRPSIVALGSQKDDPPYPRIGPLGRQKRASTGRDEVLDLTPPKRIAVTSDSSSVGTAGHSTATDVQRSSPSNQSNPAVQRRFRSNSRHRSMSARRSIDSPTG
ncbi:hypothetical protein S40285_09872 [Stachybotrys chlorohalonatus IBT 40285]|uniref:Uncharacterized protein n=1 Tax=Stachybotrys chlorohalonatus (strain IBT 40285) TaxID=1283841 RepID=A0A084QJT6_STAC4|nr:hypothetical protein S40285_09872 [Stachybotrys chlorohalonata IBT 40285]